MSWAADGQDENGLHLEKMRLVFSSLLFCLGKLVKPLIMVYSLFENSLDIFLLVFYKYFVNNKGTPSSPVS